LLTLTPTEEREEYVLFPLFPKYLLKKTSLCQIQIYSTVVIPPHFHMTSMNGYTGIQETEVLIIFCFFDKFCAPGYSSFMKHVFGMTSAHEGG
jgi:hypothetical protein